MGKKRKTAPPAIRGGRNTMQRAMAQVVANRAGRMGRVLEAVDGMEPAAAHLLLVQTVAAMEAQMREEGIEPVHEQCVSGGEFVPCRKCVHNRIEDSDDIGVVGRCMLLERKAAGKCPASALLSVRTDGCSFGERKG